MNWNKIMRFVYWSLATAFFFAAAGLVISVLKPGPTESQVMRFMVGMMSAMHTSMMGASMDNTEKFITMLQWSSGTSMLMILLGVLIGIPLKLWRKS